MADWRGAMPRAIAVTALGLVVGCAGSDGGKPPANDDAGPSAQERANQRCVETFNSSESASSQEAFVDQIGPPGPPAVFVEYSPDSRVCVYTRKFPTGSVAQSAGGAEGGSVQPVPSGMYPGPSSGAQEVRLERPSGKLRR